LFAGTSSSSSGDAFTTCSSSGPDTVLSGIVFDGALAAGGVVGLAAVPSTSASSSCGGPAGSGGGAVCRLVVLSAGGCVTLYSVMLGDAGSDMAGADLGMRSGEYCVGCFQGVPHAEGSVGALSYYAEQERRQKLP
jgi:hypothetical protein